MLDSNCSVPYMNRGSTLSPKWGIALDGLDSDQKSQVLSRMRGEVFPPGSILFMQGNPSDRLFVVEQGRVRTFQTAESGDEFTLGICSGGSTVGLSTLILDLPHNISGVTLDKSVILTVSREEFVACMQTIPKFGSNVSRLLASVVVESFDQRAYMARVSAQVRLATILVSLAQRMKPDDQNEYSVVSGITHEDLARMVGVGRPWISLKLGSFEKQGLVLQQMRRMIIINSKRFVEFIACENS